jgi:hypothetical protein
MLAAATSIGFELIAIMAEADSAPLFCTQAIPGNGPPLRITSTIAIKRTTRRTIRIKLGLSLSDDLEPALFAGLPAHRSQLQLIGVFMTYPLL